MERIKTGYRKLPEYLKSMRKKKERCMIAKFRCGNEWKGGNIERRRRKGCAGYVERRRKT